MSFANHSVAFTALFLSCATTAWASNPAVCGFEPPIYHVGTLEGQDAWTLYPPGSIPTVAQVVTAPRHNGAQAALFDQTDMFGSDYAAWACNVPLVGTDTVIEAEWDFYQVPGNGYGWFIDLVAGNGYLLGELWIDGGNILYRIGGYPDVYFTSGFLDPYTWGRFKVSMNWNTHVTEFFLNGQSIAFGAWRGTASPSVGVFRIGAVGGPSTETAGLDSISITSPHASCAADYNGDGFVTGDDFDMYVADFELGSPLADFNHDGFVTGDDFDAFVVAFTTGC